MDKGEAFEERKIECLILKEIEKARILGKNFEIDNILTTTPISRDFLERFLSSLLERNYVSYDGRNWTLTKKGRKRIKVGLMGGVFDIIHLGHIAALREAKKLCDLLVIVVARDSVVKSLKGRCPVNSEKKRLEIIKSLKFVDLAILGDEKDFSKPVKHIKPDLIILGHDQEIPPGALSGVEDVQVIKLNLYLEGESTSIILQRIKDFVKEKP